VGVAGLGDRSSPLGPSARVFGGDQPGEGHELGGRGEAVEVAHLRGDGHRRHAVDPPEAQEPPDGGVHRRALTCRLDLGIDGPDSTPPASRVAT
jgi:hypothetical protein